MLSLLVITAKANGQTTFERDIRPIFRASCIACHNIRTIKNAAVSGGLSLERLADFANARSGSRRRILTVGQPQASELYLRLVDPSPARRMPKGGRLAPDQIAKVRAWIAEGAQAGAVLQPTPPARAAQPRVEEGGTLDVVLPLERAALPTGAASPAALAIAVGPVARITALAFSPDGTRLAVGAYRAVLIWRLPEAKLERVWTGFAGAVHSLVWSAQAGLIAAAGGVPGQSGEVRVRQVDQAGGVADRDLAALAGHTDVVYSVDFSRDGQRIATASHDRSVFVWQVAAIKGAGKPAPEKEIRVHSDAVFRARFLADGARLVSASSDRTLRIVSVSSGKTEFTFDGNSLPVTATAVRPDGQVIVSGGEEPRIRWWNPGQIHTFRYGDGHAIQINDLAFSANGGVMASAGGDGTVRVWDGNSGAHRHTLREGGDWYYAVALSPSGALCAGGSGDGIVRLWDTETGALRARLVARLERQEAQWLVASPTGHMEGSEGWLKRVRLLAGGKELWPPGTTGVLSLRNAGAVGSALQGGKVDALTIPAPAAR